VIDYQDAVIGPVTYDLVSLFKDCYIEWPRNKLEHWLDKYLQLTPIELPVDRNRFIRWFDLMGVQRHLKVLGIFARLNYRDGKSQYLDDLPLTLKYVVDACNRYDELSPLLSLLESTVLQQLEAS
jgi:aminoglycoside/choline kinase family phosphotransferase